MNTNYFDQVDGHFSKFFNENKFDTNFYSSLISAITAGFHLKHQRINLLKRGEIVLDRFFFHLSKQSDQLPPFQFNQYLSEIHLNNRYAKPYLATLLNGLFFEDFDLPDLIPKNRLDHLKFFMLQILAEVAPSKVLINALSDLSLDEKVSLLCFVMRKYREGTYPILHALEATFATYEDPTKQHLYSLLAKLKKNIYDPEKLKLFLLEYPELTSETLPLLIDKLEGHVSQQVLELYQLLPNIIPKLIERPIKLTEVIEQQNKRKQIWDAETSKKMWESAFQEREEIKQKLAWQDEKKYTPETLRSFVEIFGLVGHCPPFKFRGYQYPDNSLIEKINSFLFLLNNPLAFVPVMNDLHQFENLIFSIMGHLNALTADPSKYSKGLKNITGAVPTYNKILSHFPSVQSIVHSMQTLIGYLNSLGQKKLKLKNYPIIVFDQSEETVYATNKKYLKSLNRTYKASIIHVSKAEILELAKKIGITSFIDTTHTGVLGYGGARNCAFMLTPVLKEAFKQGYKSLDQILALPTEQLRSWFRNFVLGGQHAPEPAGDAILMLDDDIQIADSNFFSHALLADLSANEYFHSSGWEQGRQTKGILFIKLQDLLNNPKILLASNKWLKTNTHFSGMSEYLTKPRFCINLPFGSEEGQSANIGKWGSYVLQPSYHLGGMRLSNKQLPTRFFVGLEDSIRAFIPYAFNIALMSSVLDVLGSKERSILPWTTKGFSETFECLKEVLTFIAKDQTKKEIQRQFWLNIHTIFKPTRTSDIIVTIINELIETDVDAIIKEFRKKQKVPLTAAERKSLIQLADHYKAYQNDATYFKEFVLLVINKITERLIDLKVKDPNDWSQIGTDVQIDFSSLINAAQKTMEQQKGISLNDYPFTKAILIIMQVIGGGEFNDSAKEILKRVSLDTEEH